MNKRYHIISALVLTVLLFGWKSNPPDARTGAPGDSTCGASSCHSQINTDIDGTITLEGLPESIEAGATYDLNVVLKAEGGSPSSGGFQMTALNGSNAFIGNFSNPGMGVGVDMSGNGRQYVDHRGAKNFSGNDVDFSVQWTAPSSLTPDVFTFYIGAIFTNGDGGRSGDRFRSSAVSVNAGTTEVDNDNDGFSEDDDCDDTNAAINPDADEIPNNDVDEDCDGEILVIDQDADRFNSDDDCDDTNAAINPDADEIPNNDVDENCDGEKLVIDQDEDGFNSDEDCDDTNGAINPDADEVPNNDVDENCDGEVAFQDLDNDGFNSDVDCDDTDGRINPDAFEIPNNDVDENCDGEIVIIDNDSDGFNSDEDCNDMNPLINPDAMEVLGDSIDNNCDGLIDDCICPTVVMPVCGSDGVTYENECRAACAGITTFTIGACLVDEDMDGFSSMDDCDDTNADINPDADEIPDNDVDENCDGVLGKTDSVLSGRILFKDDVGLSNVTIRLSNGMEVTTDDAGDFVLPSIDDISNVSMTFSRNDDHANGVSSLDLVLTINHILGKNVFDTEAKLRAADADGSGSISAIDLVQIRNVILGNWDEFRNRESWGFIPESIELSELTSGAPVQVEAYKVGDINGTAESN